MKRLLTVSLLFALCLSVSTGFAAQKRALVEFATGAWCGYCPQASIQIDDLEPKYGDNVIFLKYHTGDGMETEQTKYMASMASSGNGGGIPAMMIDRAQYKIGENTVYAMSPGYAPQIVPYTISNEALIDIQSLYEYDAATRTIKGRVYCEILQDISAQLAFNAILVEDAVTGSGSGFDQKNYYSGQTGHPYCDEPALITGYEHNNTVRYMYGGTTGNMATLPATLKAGETYYWDFEEKIPTPPSGKINVNNIRIAAIIHVAVEGYLPTAVNCCWAGVGDPETLGGSTSTTPVTMTNSSPLIKICNTITSAEYKFEFSHEGTETKKVNLSIEKIYEPEGWTASIENNYTSINVPANKDTELKIIVKAGAGSAIYKIVAQEEGSEETMEYTFNATSITATRVILYCNDEDEADFTSFLQDTDYPDCAYIGLPYFETPNKALTFISTLQNVKTCVISTGDSYSLNDATLANNIAEYLTDGVNILFTGSSTFANDPDNNTANLLYTLGFDYIGAYTNTNDAWEIPFTGVEDDVIGDGLESSLIPEQFYPARLEIKAANTTKAVLTYTEDSDSILAVRTTGEDFKAIYYGFSLNLVSDDATKLDLFNNAIYFLENDITETNAILTCENTDVDFGSVDVGGTTAQTVTISNTGNIPLNIQRINLDNQYDFKSTSTFTDPIAAGATKELTFTFTPQAEGTATGTATIVSNGGNKTLNLTGVGGTSAVNEISNTFSFNAYPNPVKTKSTITFNVLGNAHNVKMNVVDVNGNVVANLVDAKYNVGTYTVEFDASSVASSSYYIMANIDGQNAILSIIVKK